MSNKNIIGGIAIIAGTAIGAGMLALPIQTASIGFINASIIFICCWFFMTISGLYLLEVNLHSSINNANLLSMAKHSFGLIGKIITLSSYLLLLYALTAAYLSGLSNWILDLLTQYSITSVPFTAINISIAVFISILAYIGTHSMDYVNRILMVGLCITFALLLLGAINNIHLNYLVPSDKHHFSIAPLPLVITAFGYHVVIPSLTVYYKKNATLLHKAILIGSTIPLFVYILWEAMMLGVLPTEGIYGIDAIAQSGNTTVGITTSLAAITNNPWIPQISKALIFFVIITSIIGVSMSLFDFLMDALSITITKQNILVLALIVFAPPIYFVLHHPYAFNSLLSFGGIFVAVLLGILPAMMAYKARKKDKAIAYKVGGGNTLILITILFFIAIIAIEILNKLGIALVF